MTLDTFIIPRKEAVLALDLVSASLSIDLPSGIALSDTDSYLRLSTLFSFHQIQGPFSSLILQAAHNEGTRRMMMKQKLHSRIQATKDPSKSLLEWDASQPTTEDE